MAREPVAVANVAGEPNDVTLAVARYVALAASLATAVYVAADVEPSALMMLILFSGPALAVVIWLQKDAQRTGVGAVLDFGYFLFLAWPVVIPWYAFKTRGRGGWRLVAELFGLIAAPWATGVATAYALWQLRG
jgi:hypothetical protein